MPLRCTNCHHKVEDGSLKDCAWCDYRHHTSRIIRKTIRVLSADDVRLAIEQTRIRVEEASWTKIGCICPVCEGRVIVDKRGLNPKMVEFLIWLVDTHFESKTWAKMLDYPDWSAVKKRGGDPWKLRFWGLVRRQGVSDEDENTKVAVTRTTGFVQPTDLAYEFVHGRSTVPRFTYTYKSRLLEVSDEQTAIEDVMSGPRGFNAADLRVSGKPTRIIRRTLKG